MSQESIAVSRERGWFPTLEAANSAAIATGDDRNAGMDRRTVANGQRKHGFRGIN